MLSYSNRYKGYILYNLLRFPIKKLFNHGSISGGLIQRISPKAKLYATQVDSRINIENGVRILDNTIVEAAGGTVNIGENVFINRNCMMVSKKLIDIGNNTTIGPSVMFYDHDHDYRNEEKGKFITNEIKIGKNVWIGANSIILKGTIIGDNCVVAAGTVARGVIPSDSLVYSKNDLIIKSKKEVTAIEKINI